MDTAPILLLIFNRPDATAIVFEKIRERKPHRLYIAADGPRENKAGEKQICEQARRIVVDNIDWDCRVETLFRDKNLGCGRAVSSAITWFFDHETEGIILEDDCVPNESFFFFCSELLEHYRDDQRVMHISGTILNDREEPVTATCHFSTYPLVWGWATWKRAWNSYDFELKDTNFYSKLIRSAFTEPFERKLWQSILNSVHAIDTWDYQWMFAILKAGGLCANTNYNFVLNIGFDELATHTNYNNPNPLAAESLTEIVLPKKIVRNKKAEGAFLRAAHNLKQQGYLKYFLFRGGNLIHKLKLFMKDK